MNDFHQHTHAKSYVASKIQFFLFHSHFIRNLVLRSVCMWQKYFFWHRFKPSVHVSYIQLRNVCIYMQGILGEIFFITSRSTCSWLKVRVHIQIDKYVPIKHFLVWQFLYFLCAIFYFIVYCFILTYSYGNNGEL